MSLFETDASKAVFTKMLLQGALAGTSVAATVGMFNLLKQLKSKANFKDEEDETIVLNAKKAMKKLAAEGSVPPTEAALGMLGAAGGGLAAYYLTRRAIQEFREHSLKEELRQAERAYLQKSYDLDQAREGSKQAASDLTTGETVMALPTLVLIATLLGGGALTTAFLNKHYPKPDVEVHPKKKLKPVTPRKRNITFDNTGTPDTPENGSGDSDIDEEDAGAPDYSKGHVVYASADIVDNYPDMGREYLLRRIMENPVQAEASGFDVLVKAAACGMCDEIADSTDDIDELFENASTATKDKPEPSDNKKNLGVMRICSHPKMGPMTEPLIASEYNDMAPSQVHAMGGLGDDERSMIMSVIDNVLRGERMSDLAPHASKMLPEGGGMKIRIQVMKSAAIATPEMDYDEGLTDFSKALDTILCEDGTI